MGFRKRARRGLVASVAGIAAAIVVLATSAGPAAAGIAPISSLAAGQRLNVGDELTSPSGRFILVMQGDGNLVEYDLVGNRAVWWSGTYGTGAAFLAMQADRNLVLYTAAGKPVWWTGTSGAGTGTLDLQDDGNLVLYADNGSGPLWYDGVQLGGIIPPGSTLHGGQMMTSPSGAYELAMQTDGNLVLYTGGQAVWSTGTYGHPGAFLVYQLDGNVVLYSAAMVPLWFTSTFGLPGPMTVQDDGNIGVYDSSLNPEWTRWSFAPNGYEFGNNAVWTVSGRGNGHGHGLSQWGAYGAAAAGLTWQQIISFYYPGTTQAGGAAATPVRVKLDMANSGGVVTIGDTAGTVVSDTADGASWSFPGYSQLRAASDAATGKQRLQGLTASGWVAIALPGRAEFTGQASFSNSSTNIVHVVFVDGTAKDVRGSVRATGTGTLYPVNVVGLDDYVKGVLPREMPSSWLPNALDAQAVAVRTYALYAVQHNGASPYDICSTTNCQVYGGVAGYDSAGNLISGLGEVASTNQAVADTSGVVANYGAGAAFTQFSASDGGYTVDGGQPYLPAQADPYDGYLNNSSHFWSGTVSAAQIKAAYPQLANLEWVQITARTGGGDFGGRVSTVVVRGVDVNRNPVLISMTGSQLAAIAGWRNNFFGFNGS